MREILFRGQTRKKGEKVRLDGTPVDGNWVYGGVAQFNEERAIIYQTEPEFHKFSVYADTVGQFTGLTDKNGKKIFEGDIVKYENKIYEIKYLEKYARFAPSNEHSIFMVCAFNHLEVVGNIHDNPGLMRGE